MHNPPHPGEILKEEFMIPLNLTVDTLANKLEMPNKILLDIINEEIGISSDVAIKLSKEFDTSVTLWTRLQEDFYTSQDRN